MGWTSSASTNWRKDGKIILFPTAKEREEGKIDLIISGLKSESGQEMLINMIEAGLKEVPEDLLLKAFREAEPIQKELIEFQKEIQKQMGLPKLERKECPPNEELKKAVLIFLGDRLEKSLFQKTEKTEDLKMN